MNRNSIRVTDVDNPPSTYTQTLHEKQIGSVKPGKISVPTNMVTLLGGFAKFGGTTLQNETVKRFKNIYEAAQIGGAKARDPSVDPVDGGGVHKDAAHVFGADARIEYRGVKMALGPEDLRRLEYVVIGEKGPTSYTKWRTGIAKPNARAVAKAKHEFRIIVLRLAHHWKLAQTVKGRRDLAAWSDGTEALPPSRLDGAA